MATEGGPKLVSDGLVLALDAVNKKSTLKITQNSNILPDPGNWIIGTGGQSGYNPNGGSSEQNRVLVSDDPWGRKSVTWRTTPDATSGADGGWNSSYYAVDNSYTYRYSMWVRRYTSGTGGNFYMGMNPNPLRNDNNNSQGNPYFSYPSISSLTQNQWYLIVAHVFYEGYTGGRHPESGWYENGVKISDKSFGNVGNQDVRWDPSTTSARHRAYHYYTTNINSGIEFAYPRIDKIDGNEPSIADLINRGESGWVNLVGDDIGQLNNGIQYNLDGIESSFEFDGIDNHIELDPSLATISNIGSIEAIIKPTDNSPGGIVGWGDGGTSNWGGFDIGNRSSGQPNEVLTFINFSSNNTNQLVIFGSNGESTNQLNDGKYHHVVAVIDGVNNTLYLDGIELPTKTFTHGSSTTQGFMNMSVLNKLRIGNSTYNNGHVPFKGEIPLVKIYNKGLTPQEVLQNYNATKSRFNL